MFTRTLEYLLSVTSLWLLVPLVHCCMSVTVNTTANPSSLDVAVLMHLLPLWLMLLLRLLPDAPTRLTAGLFFITFIL